MHHVGPEDTRIQKTHREGWLHFNICCLCVVVTDVINAFVWRIWYVSCPDDKGQLVYR
jgi:hypothetical protein